MKKMSIVFLLCAFAAQFTVMAQNQQKFLYQTKIAKYNKMKNAGIGLTVGGAILTVVGISSMSNAVATDPDLITDEGASKFALGYLVTVLGVTASGGGIVLWAIGGSKKKSYTNRLNALSLNLNPAHNQVFSLAYRF